MLGPAPAVARGESRSSRLRSTTSCTRATRVLLAAAARPRLTSCCGQSTAAGILARPCIHPHASAPFGHDSSRAHLSAAGEPPTRNQLGVSSCAIAMTICSRPLPIAASTHRTPRPHSKRVAFSVGIFSEARWHSTARSDPSSAITRLFQQPIPTFQLQRVCNKHLTYQRVQLV